MSTVRVFADCKLAYVVEPNPDSPVFLFEQFEQDHYQGNLVRLNQTGMSTNA